MKIVTVDRRPFKEDETIVIYEKFVSIYKLHLPFDEMQEFLAFEEKLKEGDSIAENPVRVLYYKFFENGLKMCIYIYTLG